MLVRRWLGPLSLGLALSLAACTGNAGGGAEEGGNSGGKKTGGNGGSSNGGASGGTTGSVAPGKDPGSVALHRLSKVEYNNTVRDLLGTKLRPADDFGFDDLLSQGKFGFGNNANALTLGSTEAGYYQAAAEKLANEAVAAKPSAIWSCTSGDDACIKTIVSNLAKRAYRRPVQDSEVTNLLALVKLAKDNGDSADVGIGLAIQALLTSPHFLFRVEIDPDPNSVTPHQITSWEMATRLSYFLWATMPDATLFTAAEQDKLKSTSDVGAQVDRMLKDGKAKDGLVANFGDYWTMNNSFLAHNADTTKFPSYNMLKDSMLAETRMMLNDLFTGALSFDKFMYGDYTYANDALATHYGLDKPGSTTMTKVKTSDDKHRGSFLTNATVLAATSEDAVTSVVQRGKYVLFQMMCGNVGPPQMDVPALSKSPGNTVREKFAAHESKPECAACHKILDPPGLALEQYDPVGAYRTKDNGYDIDAKVDVILSDGSKQTVNDAIQMAKYVSTSDGYAECVSKALYSYALGRRTDASDGGGDMDDGVLDGIKKTLKDSGWKFQDSVKQIVSSDTFRMRRTNKGVMQ
jgi:hypothetical protein